VNVGAKEYPVSRVVVVRALVRSNVRRLQCVVRVAVSYGTATAISIEQILMELHSSLSALLRFVFSLVALRLDWLALERVGGCRVGERSHLRWHLLLQGPEHLVAVLFSTMMLFWGERFSGGKVISSGN
jgi:hypothetical protein